jgi:hypothetical protein
MPQPKPVDWFMFGVTLYYGVDPDSIRMPSKFTDVVDVKTN